MNRTLNVVKLQFINRNAFVWVPLIVLASAFVISLLIYLVIPVPADTPKFSGGAQAPMWCFFFVGLQAVTMTFPFSQALSITRREFFFGTVLSAALASGGLGILFLLLGFMEDATGGWGLSAQFFHLTWIWEQGPAIAFLFFFALSMLFFMVGFGCATVYKRYGSIALMAILFGIALVFIGAAWVIGQFDAWVEVFQWLAEFGASGLGITLLCGAALVGVLSYPATRRSIP